MSPSSLQKMLGKPEAAPGTRPSRNLELLPLDLPFGSVAPFSSIALFASRSSSKNQLSIALSVRLAYLVTRIHVEKA